MISPPTDRLHKLLAVGGVALVISSVTIPLQKYQDAETQRIEAYAKAQELQFTYKRYADHVNHMIGIRNDAVSRRLKDSEMVAAKDKVQALNPEAEKLGRETEHAIVDLVKQAELAVHFEWIKRVWFGLGLLGILLGGTMALLGFRRWLRLPQHER